MDCLSVHSEIPEEVKRVNEMIKPRALDTFSTGKANRS
jgi:hypothetical protein